MFLGCKVNTKTPLTQKPNFIFLFADDFTYSAIHALGNEEIKTPNLDRMVQAGTTFTHAYNMGAWNGAVCVASRAMLISGLSVWEAQEQYHGWFNGEDVKETWPMRMQSNGYETYMGGKWHLTANTEEIFDHVIHQRPGGMPSDYWDFQKMRSGFEALKEGEDPAHLMPLGYNRPKNENDTLWHAADKKHRGYWQGGIHWSELLKNDVISFLDTRTEAKPLFMYLAFNAPHDPRQAPQEYLDMYPLEEISVPQSWLEEYPNKAGIGQKCKVIFNVHIGCILFFQQRIYLKSLGIHRM